MTTRYRTTCRRLAATLLLLCSCTAAWGAEAKPSLSAMEHLIVIYQENQYQIDGGKNDKFAAWSDNGGLVISYLDATDMPLGKLAREYTLADHRGGR
jgi:phospholipase C